MHIYSLWACLIVLLICHLELFLLSFPALSIELINILLWSIYKQLTPKLAMKKSKSNSKQNGISGDHSMELHLIGCVIKELRFNYGLLTQKELAYRCGVHFNTILAIEHGDRNYNLKSLLKIINHFEYDLSTFIKEFL